MLQNVMQGKRDRIIDGSVGPVGELVRIQLMISGCLQGPENQALEHFHDYGGQSDRSVVVQACYAGQASGTGTMVEVLKHRGTWHCSSDLLKRAVNTGASWSAHDLRVAGDTLSGPDAFLGFWLRKRLLTSLCISKCTSWISDNNNGYWARSITYNMDILFP